MFLNSLRKKIASVPSYINGNRLGYGIRLFFRNSIKIPLVVTTRRGAILFLGNDQIDDLILRDLNGRLASIYFPPELLLQANDVVFDIGGHHGVFALELIAIFPECRVYSFEPDKSSISYFKFNLFLNRESNVRLIEAALGSVSQDAYLVKSEEGSWGNFVESFPIDHSIKIKRIAIEDVIQRFSISKIKFAKFNAEGAEFSVIDEMFRLKVFPELILLFAHPERGDIDNLLISIYSQSYSLVRKNDDQNRPWFLFQISTV